MNNTMIKGLVIWACSNCRSMMGLYDELQKLLGVKVVVALWNYKKNSCEITARERLGFKSDEFSGLNMIPVGADWNRGVAVLNEHRGFRHLFAVYQAAPNFCKLMVEAHRRGERIGVISEAPCNSERGLRYFMKQYVYLPYVLKRKVQDVVRISDFILNLSGDHTAYLRLIGWEDKKIIPFGYFPPALPGSVSKERIFGGGLHILSTGIMEWRRGPDILLKALGLLKTWNVNYRATITQGGPMFAKLQKFAEARQLPVRFCGFLPMDELIRLYQECSVYVATGRREPWGMRLNDALNCGAPLIVSRGMGGVKLVDELGCGLSFEADDYVDLAHKLKKFADDESLYIRCARAASVAASKISPKKKVIEMLKSIRESSPDWI